MGALQNLTITKTMVIFPRNERDFTVITVVDDKGQIHNITVHTDAFRRKLERVRDGMCDCADRESSIGVFAFPEKFTPEYRTNNFWEDLFDLSMRDFNRLIRSLE